MNEGIRTPIKDEKNLNKNPGAYRGAQKSAIATVKVPKNRTELLRSTRKTAVAGGVARYGRRALRFSAASTPTS